jgi:alkane 1-monooxygenase
MNWNKKISFLKVLILPLLVWVSASLGGWWNFLVVGFVFFLLPIADHWIGLDKENVAAEEVKEVENDLYFRFITYLWVFVQVTFVIWSIYAVSTQQIKSVPEWIGFVLSCAIVNGGIGITVAHELGHKKSALERFYSKLLLMMVCYMHFYIEHNRGHHVTIATPEDPATARKDENFYRFWFRSVFAGYAHAWKLEKEKLQRKNQSVVSWRNEMIRFILFPLLFLTLLTSYFSPAHEINWAIPIFFFAQSIAGFTLLELVNYIEHYGIVRKEIAPGKYERVNPLHSWNASHLVSNSFLFQLQRHSDHHAHALKRYPVLNHYDESPQLPFGYPTMILIALLPPLWFTMMNPRLEEWKNQQPTFQSAEFKL